MTFRRRRRRSFSRRRQLLYVVFYNINNTIIPVQSIIWTAYNIIIMFASTRIGREYCTEAVFRDVLTTRRGKSGGTKDYGENRVGKEFIILVILLLLLLRLLCYDDVTKTSSQIGKWNVIDLTVRFIYLIDKQKLKLKKSWTISFKERVFAICINTYKII